MTLILHDLPAWHWSIVGVAIAALMLLLLYVTNVALGMSTGFESMCSLVSDRPYFRRPGLTKTNARRLTMFAGLFAGGVLSAQLGGGWTTTWDLGRFDELISSSPGVKVAWMFVGGVLVGFGTRLGGGCTSGHAVFGFPNGDRASLRTMVMFMVTGVITANIVYRVVFVGAS